MAGLTVPFQIPWASSITLETEFHYNKPVWIHLHYGGVTAGVQVHNGAVFAWNHWEIKVHEYMKKDEALTRNLLEYLDAFSATRLSPITKIARWITNDPPQFISYGKKEWRPSSWEPAKPAWKIGHLKAGSNVDLSAHHGVPTNVSRNFHYTHFLAPEGAGLIMADAGIDHPQVFFGDPYDLFWALNEFSDLSNPKTPAWINIHFENGILWVLDYLGKFDDDELPDWAKKAVKENPDLLWPDLVARLKDQELAPWLKEVVHTWTLKHGIPEKPRD